MTKIQNSKLNPVRKAESHGSNLLQSLAGLPNELSNGVNQKALTNSQDFLMRRATESHRIFNKENRMSVSQGSTLVDNTLRQTLRNDNYITVQNKNNPSFGEVVSDSLQNTDTRLTLKYFNYSKPRSYVKCFLTNFQFFPIPSSPDKVEDSRSHRKILDGEAIGTIN